MLTIAEEIIWNLECVSLTRVWGGRVGRAYIVL